MHMSYLIESIIKIDHTTQSTKVSRVYLYYICLLLDIIVKFHIFSLLYFLCNKFYDTRLVAIG